MLQRGMLNFQFARPWMDSAEVSDTFFSIKQESIQFNTHVTNIKSIIKLYMIIFMQTIDTYAMYYSAYNENDKGI